MKITAQQQQYESFLRSKKSRPLYDVYACFQPFNEALKALYPFFKIMKTQVKTGDVILNLWDRTGWTANLLAGLFPEQKIITTWEGNKDVLGYKGFQYWFGENPQIKVLFTPLNAPLPFEDHSIKYCVGLDTLHRLDKELMLPELLRVVDVEGAILFPHVHMANSQPDPYFDRGGDIIHGKVYDRLFKDLLISDTRKAFVFSEPKLFVFNEGLSQREMCVQSTPDTSDYNGLIGIFPKNWEGEVLQPFVLNDFEEQLDSLRIVSNPIPRVDLNLAKVYLDPDHLGGQAGYLLERHPIYVNRLKGILDEKLSATNVQILYLAQTACSVAMIKQKLNLSTDEIMESLGFLEQSALVQVLPIGEQAARLQHYLAFQEFVPKVIEQTFPHLWKQVTENFPEKEALQILEEQVTYTYSDCLEIVGEVEKKLTELGLEKGDRILLSSSLHPEAILLVWGALLRGIVVIPVSPKHTATNMEYILTLCKPKICFLSTDIYESNAGIFDKQVIVYFDEEDLENAHCFSEWLDTTVEEVPSVVLMPEDEAVILFTSGSTGKPKGVHLSQGQIYRSGLIVNDSFRWKTEDVFFAVGGLESMSGFRNAAITALHSGSQIVIPPQDAQGNFFGLVDAIEEGQATLLGANPAFLRQLCKFKERIGRAVQSLRQVICTGNDLNEELRSDFKEAYHLELLNYYGLTETTGICLTQREDKVNPMNGNVGIPVACIAQVVNEEGETLPPEEKGHLRIFSENITKGYLGKSKRESEEFEENWFYTQDLAKFNEDGEVILLGRLRSFIKMSNEEIVYLQEVEQCIRANEKVEDVAVYSQNVQDRELLFAYVVPSEGAMEGDFRRELRQFIVTQLSEQKCPTKIIITDSIPYSNNGKLLKHELSSNH